MTWSETCPLGLPHEVYKAPSAAIVAGFACRCKCAFCILSGHGRQENTFKEVGRQKKADSDFTPLGADEFVAFYEAMVKVGARSINNKGIDPFSEKKN